MSVSRGGGMSSYGEKLIIKSILDGSLDICPREARTILVNKLDTLRLSNGTYIRQQIKAIEIKLAELKSVVTEMNIKETNSKHLASINLIKKVMRETIPHDDYIKVLREVDRRIEQKEVDK